MPEKKKFGKRLQALRNKAGLSQAELGRLVGVQMQTVWRWENGEREPSLDVISMIAKVLHITEAELLNGPEAQELKINFYWEVEKDMTLMDVRANEFNFGYRSNDNALLLAGALPFDMPTDDILSRIRAEIEAAKAGKIARDKALRRDKA